METKKWYIKHGYTSEEYANLMRFHSDHKRRMEKRRAITRICNQLGLQFLSCDRSVNADSLESIKAAISVLRSKKIEPVKVLVSTCGSYQYSAFYDF
jgi:hypothetical protein